MKKVTLLSTMIGALLLAGCASYQGGSEADFESAPTDTAADTTMDNMPNRSADADTTVGWGATRLDRRSGPVVPPP